MKSLKQKSALRMLLVAGGLFLGLGATYAFSQTAFYSSLSDELIVKLNATFNASATPDKRVVINTSGNVGIGIEPGASKLKVAGIIESTTDGIKFPDGTTQTTAPNIGSGTAGKIAKWLTGGTTIGNSIISEISGNVGIGTTNLFEKLTVEGSILATSNIISNALLGASDNRSVCADRTGKLTVCGAPVITISANPNPIAGPFTAGSFAKPGQSTTLTWLSSDTGVTCVASGGWSGSKASSGAISVSPAVTTTYTLSCTSTTTNLTGVGAVSVTVNGWKDATGTGIAGESCNTFLQKTGQTTNSSQPVGYYRYGIAPNYYNNQCIYLFTPDNPGDGAECVNVAYYGLGDAGVNPGWFEDWCVVNYSATPVVDPIFYQGSYYLRTIVSDN